MGVKSVKELTVYIKAYRLAMLIFADLRPLLVVRRQAEGSTGGGGVSGHFRAAGGEGGQQGKPVALGNDLVTRTTFANGHFPVAKVATKPKVLAVCDLRRSAPPGRDSFSRGLLGGGQFLA
jgi:hypothetical protein